MLATSRTWRSMRSMLAAWPLLCRAGARAGEQWAGGPALLQIMFPLGTLRPFRTTFPRGKIQPAHTFCSRPFPRRLCLIHSGRAVAVQVAAAVPAEVARAVVEAVKAAPAAEAPAAEAPAAEARVAEAARAALAVVLVVVADPAAAAAAATPFLITTIPLTTSRGPS